MSDELRGLEQLETTSDYQSIMDALGLEVIGEGEDGRIVLYSKASRKKVSLRNLNQAKRVKLIQICGASATETIDNAGVDAVQEAIAEAAFHARRLSVDSERRQGIWETEDGSIAVVGAGRLCKWNGQTLLQADSSIEGSVFYDTTSGVWQVDFPQLKEDLEQFDREKAREAFGRLCDYLSHWIWIPGDLERNAKVALIVAALLVATFIQTIWNWRPQVSVSGASHSGKSTLADFFLRIFGKLAVVLEKTTPAGLRQALRSSATVCLLDEFENDEHRMRVLDMIKTSGNGSTICRGTMDQQGIQFRVQHLFWVAAIEDGIRRIADVNRFIRLELHKPSDTPAPLKLPNKTEGAELHRHLLAAAIYYAMPAKKLVETLVNSSQLNVDARIVENYAVPVAMASLILGDEANAEVMLREAMTLIPIVQDFSSDHDDLLATILESHLSVPEEGTVSVRQAIRSVLESGQFKSVKHDALKLRGIRVLVKDQQRFILLAPQLIERFLLKGTSWKGKVIRSILRRIPGAVESQQRFDETRDRAVFVPASVMELSDFVPVLELPEVES